MNSSRASSCKQLHNQQQQQRHHHEGREDHHERQPTVGARVIESAREEREQEAGKR